MPDRDSPSTDSPEGRKETGDPLQIDEDMHLTDLKGFEDAEECPECGNVRPFGDDCRICGWEAPNKTPDRRDQDRDQKSSAKSIDRPIFAAVTATSEAVAIAKGRAALGLIDPPDHAGGMDILEDVEDPETLFPGKWGKLSPAVDVSTDIGTAICEQLQDDLENTQPWQYAWDAPLYDESGTPITTVGELETLVGVDDCDTEGRMWLVPAIAYKSPVTAKPDDASKDLDCLQCDGNTVHVFEGRSTGKSTSGAGADRSEPPIWTCTECGCGQYAPRPHEEGESSHSDEGTSGIDAKIDQAEREQFEDVMSDLAENGDLP